MKIEHTYDYDMHGRKVLSLKVEIPPSRRSVFILDEVYFLSFPSIIFNIFVNYDGNISVGIGYKIDNKIYLCNLPNTSNSFICMNNLTLSKLKMKKRSVKDLNINLLASKFINYFWSSSFNYGVYRNIINYTKSGYTSNYNKYYKNWKTQTLKNPKYCLDIKNLKYLCSYNNFKKVCIKDNYLTLNKRRKFVEDKVKYKQFHNSMKKSINNFLDQDYLDKEDISKVINHIWEHTNISHETFVNNYLINKDFFLRNFAVLLNQI